MGFPNERSLGTLRYLINTMTIRYLLAHRFSGQALRAVFRGVRDGLFRKPDLSDDFSRSRQGIIGSRTLGGNARDIITFVAQR